MEVQTCFNRNVPVFVSGFNILKWNHLCLILAQDITVYVDGDLFTTLKVTVPSDLSAGITGGGVLILGQDQDKPGGGFYDLDSFSGAVADLQLFSRALTSEEVLSMSQCQMPPSDAIVTLAGDWELSNVTQYNISRWKLCIPVHNNYFIFHDSITPDTNRRMCAALHGYMPREEDRKPMLPVLQQYLSHHYSDYVKLHFHLEPDSPSQGKCKDIMITWGPGVDIYMDIYKRSCTLNITTFMCKIPVDTYLKLFGLPAKLEDKLHTKYRLHLRDGYHYLRGIEKSHIFLSGQYWCLHVLNQPEAVMCHESATDFPPVGRRNWVYDVNSTVAMVLTSCYEEQFTCDSGDCIDLHKRCDTFPDCEDRSDEDKCNLVRIDYDQRQSMTSVPSISLRIGARINVTNIPQINLPQSDFTTNLWISLTWQDDRQAYYNLIHGAENLISDVMMRHYMWVPEVLLQPTRNGDEAKMTTTTIRVKENCNGKPSICSAREGTAKLLILSPLHLCFWNLCICIFIDAHFWIQKYIPVCIHPLHLFVYVNFHDYITIQVLRMKSFFW